MPKYSCELLGLVINVKGKGVGIRGSHERRGFSAWLPRHVGGDSSHRRDEERAAQGVELLNENALQPHKESSILCHVRAKAGAGDAKAAEEDAKPLDSNLEPWLAAKAARQHRSQAIFSAAGGAYMVERSELVKGVVQQWPVPIVNDVPEVLSESCILLLNVVVI